MKVIFSKLFSIFLIVFFAAVLNHPHVFAAENYVDKSPAEALYKSRTQGSLNVEGMGFVHPTIQLAYFVEKILGAIPGVTAMADNPEYNKQISEGSAINGTTKLIAMMYENPPASTYAFVRDIGQTLGFIPKQTYAQGQGLGFTGLSPLLPIWKAFRNIAYLLLAIIMIVVGFMIMLRKNIDPKTVVTVQNALPRIVITMILITFSYAIVGLLIDVMYIVLLLFANMIYSVAKPTMFPTPSDFVQSNFFVTIGAMFGGGMSSLDDMIRFLFPGLVLHGSTVFDLGAWMAKVMALLPIALVPSAILLIVILAVAILFMVVRIFFLLLSAYIQIIISLLIGPLQILMDAIPGGKGFESWIKNLISNLLVFPITAAMLLIGVMFTQSNISDVWSPPMIGAGKGEGMLGIIGLGVLAVIPSVVKNLQKAIKAESPVPAGMGAILGPMGSGAMQALTIAYQLKFLKGGEHTPLAPGSSTLERSVAAGKGPKV